MDNIVIARINQNRLFKDRNKIKSKEDKNKERCYRILCLIYENQQKIDNDKPKRKRWYNRLFGN